MSIVNEQLPGILLSLPEVEVEAKTTTEHHYLVFEFRNHFSTSAAEKACQVWTQFHQHQNQSAVHIWNCSRMSSFDMAAKSIWMKHMKACDNLIERIILVSDMILIRGAARLMSKFSKHQLDVYKSLSEMEQKERLV